MHSSSAFFGTSCLLTDGCFREKDRFATAWTVATLPRGGFHGNTDSKSQNLAGLTVAFDALSIDVGFVEQFSHLPNNVRLHQVTVVSEGQFVTIFLLGLGFCSLTSVIPSPQNIFANLECRALDGSR